MGLFSGQIMFFWENMISIFFLFQEFLDEVFIKIKLESYFPNRGFILVCNGDQKLSLVSLKRRADT